MATKAAQSGTNTTLLVDIGSTVIKLAVADADGRLQHQELYDRDFDAKIVDQLDGILSTNRIATNTSDLVICSSANGGLRVGIVSLTGSYSGSVFRNQALLSGANPVYVEQLGFPRPTSDRIDVLLVGGGIDIAGHEPLLARLMEFDPSSLQYGSLVYAGNRYYSDVMRERFPDVKVVANPMAAGLADLEDSVFVALRDAYLDDLVYKEGISEVAAAYRGSVFPTPQVVSLGYQRCLTEQRFPAMTGASMLIDIGGATTDFHYTTEVVRDDSESRPAPGSSIARYVFPDLGVFSSRDSTISQLRQNPRSYDFLKIVYDGDVSDYYRQLREGECELSPHLLAFACVFLGLDRFARGIGPGLPSTDLAKLNNIAFTGGAAQLLNPAKTAAIVNLFLNVPVTEQFVIIDSNYEIWVHGAVSHRQLKPSHVKTKNIATAT